MSAIESGKTETLVNEVPGHVVGSAAAEAAMVLPFEFAARKKPSQYATLPTDVMPVVVGANTPPTKVYVLPPAAIKSPVPPLTCPYAMEQSPGEVTGSPAVIVPRRIAPKPPGLPVIS